MVHIPSVVISLAQCQRLFPLGSLWHARIYEEQQKGQQQNFTANASHPQTSELKPENNVL